MQASLPLVEIVIPVHDQAAHLRRIVETLRAYVRVALPCRWRITIADDGRTDQSRAIGRHLAAVYSEVTAIHLDEQGQGRAIQHAWLASDADIVVAMDHELSTDPKTLVSLVAPLLARQSDLRTGAGSGNAARAPSQRPCLIGYDGDTTQSHTHRHQCVTPPGEWWHRYSNSGCSAAPVSALA